MSSFVQHYTTDMFINQVLTVDKENPKEGMWEGDYEAYYQFPKTIFEIESNPIELTYSAVGESVEYTATIDSAAFEYIDDESNIKFQYDPETNRLLMGLYKVAIPTEAGVIPEDLEKEWNVRGTWASYVTRSECFNDQKLELDLTNPTLNLEFENVTLAEMVEQSFSLGGVTPALDEVPEVISDPEEEEEEEENDDYIVTDEDLENEIVVVEDVDDYYIDEEEWLEDDEDTLVVGDDDDEENVIPPDPEDPIDYSVILVKASTTDGVGVIDVTIDAITKDTWIAQTGPEDFPFNAEVKYDSASNAVLIRSTDSYAADYPINIEVYFRTNAYYFGEEVVSEFEEQVYDPQVWPINITFFGRIYNEDYMTETSEYALTIDNIDTDFYSEDYPNIIFRYISEDNTLGMRIGQLDAPQEGATPEILNTSWSVTAEYGSVLKENNYTFEYVG